MHYHVARCQWLGWNRAFGTETDWMGSRFKLSDLPSPPLDVGAHHQLPAPSETLLGW
jgi:hypothetical protein